MWRPTARRVAVAALLAAITIAGCAAPAPPTGPAPTTIRGRVIGFDGEPVVGAEIRGAQRSTRTNREGGFVLELAADRGEWVTASGQGYMARTRAGAPGSDLLFRLTPDDGRTVSIQFTGDVMMGRRFFDPNEDGNTDDALLRPDSPPAQYDQLLSPISPLLSSTDLTVANVESSISATPYFNPRAPRPASFHPTKEFVYASAPGLPAAIGRAGIDLANLANNHQYDLLEPGVQSTIDDFDRGGFRREEGQYGLGRNVTEAYTPAVRTVKGSRIAFLGCTTVLGQQQLIGYGASPTRGGAAPCDETLIRNSVSAAAAANNAVVFSIHGGYEYERGVTSKVQQFSDVARQAGARLVMNHHPHVVGGFSTDGTSITTYSLGNLIFDQNIWPSFQAYTVTAYVRDNQIIRAYAEPLLMNNFVAHGVDGGLADYINKVAAGQLPGPFVIEDGAVEIDLGGRGRPQTESAPTTGTSNGTIYEAAAGWLPRVADPTVTQPGNDLLWVGDFENEVVGDNPGALWDTDGDDKSVVLDRETGTRSLRLRRSPGDQSLILTGPRQRALLTDPRARLLRLAQGTDTDALRTPLAPPAPGSGPDVSLIGAIRASPGARLEVQLSWYPGLGGASNRQTIVTVDGRGLSNTQPLRVDAKAPEDAVAVGLFIKLMPPGATPQSGSQEIEAYLDKVQLVQWAPRATPIGPSFTHVRSFDDTPITLQRTLLPGAGPNAGLGAGPGALREVG